MFIYYNIKFPIVQNEKRHPTSVRYDLILILKRKMIIYKSIYSLFNILYFCRYTCNGEFVRYKLHMIKIISSNQHDQKHLEMTIILGHRVNRLKRTQFLALVF